MNYSEQALWISCHCTMVFTIGSNHWNQGTNCTPVGIKLGVARSHFFYILLWINAICKCFYNIDYRKVPFFYIVIPNSSYLMVIENLYLILLCHYNKNIDYR